MQHLEGKMQRQFCVSENKVCSLQNNIACQYSVFLLMDHIRSSLEWLASSTKCIHHYYITCIQNAGDKGDKNAFLDLHHFP